MASTKKTEQDKITRAEGARRQAAQTSRFEGNWYRNVMTTRVSDNVSIRQSFSVVREQNSSLRLSGMMASGAGAAFGLRDVYDVRLEGAVLKFEDDAPNGTTEYSGSLSADGSRLRFAFLNLPPTPTQMKIREQWGGIPPSGRFGGEEWLKE